LNWGNGCFDIIIMLCYYSSSSCELGQGMSELERQIKKRQAANARKGVLTEDQVREAKVELRNGVHPRVIAKGLGVSTQTIVRIRDGETWAWVKIEKGVEVAPTAEELGVSPQKVAASLEEVLKRVAAKGEGGEGIAALGAAMKEERAGEDRLRELIGDRAGEI